MVLQASGLMTVIRFGSVLVFLIEVERSNSKLTKSGWTIRQTLTTENGLAGAKVRSIYQDRQRGALVWLRK